MKQLFSISLLLVLSSVVSSTVIDFESGLDSQFTYSDVRHSPFSPSANSGYRAMSDHTGSNNWLFNGYEASPSTFSWNGTGTTFDLTSFAIAGAWGSQTLTFEGILNNVVQYSTTFAVDNLAVDIFNAGWLGIDALRISTGNDFVRASNVTGNGRHWVLDNLTFNESATVPEPSSFALIALGLLGLRMTRKRA